MQWSQTWSATVVRCIISLLAVLKSCHSVTMKRSQSSARLSACGGKADSMIRQASVSFVVRQSYMLQSLLEVVSRHSSANLLTVN